MKNYDLIWIGSGQATGTVIPRLIEKGKTVAIAEGDRFGGSCVNYGCTPTKTIIASARAAHMARRGSDFGVLTGEIKIDFAKVMQRQNQIRTQSSQGMEKWLTNMPGVDVYPSGAILEDAHTLLVGDDRIQADTIVINAGARARSIPIPGLDEVDWLDNVRLLDLQELPQHLIIVGGSYISLEFAQAFRRFGSQVSILEASPQLMFREDGDIAQIVKETLEKEGIQIFLNANIKQFKSKNKKFSAVLFEYEGKEHTLQGSHILLAVGRMPNSDRLNLEAADVQTDQRGYIQVNDILQTNIPHIYALGDINGQGAFTHTSVNDGEIFWDNYSGTGDRRLSDRIITYAMFIDPPLGRVGMSEKDARASGRNVLMAARPMSAIARAREKDETTGLIKILVDADNEQFLGATILGVGGDEIINIFKPFMLTKQSYKLFRKAVLIHPTVAELLPWILDDLKQLE